MKHFVLLDIAVAPVTDANWQSLVIESESPVLVEFWAPWCVDDYRVTMCLCQSFFQLLKMVVIGEESPL